MHFIRHFDLESPCGTVLVQKSTTVPFMTEGLVYEEKGATTTAKAYHEKSRVSALIVTKKAYELLP